MFTVISRIVHYGFANFWRNALPSAATVAILTNALIIFLGLIFFNVIMTAAVGSVESKIDISVFFKTSTPEDEILNVQQALESLEEVKGVEYISPDRALELFKEQYANDPTISQAINESTDNPLEASLNIQAKDPNQYEAIAEYLGSPSLAPLVDKVSYTENKAAIDKLISMVNNLNRGGWILTILQALIAGLVVFNTIQLAIYSNRDEIAIMRSVGASNLLVRGPYVVEGVIAGAIAAIISILIFAPVAYLAAPYLARLVGELDIFRYFYTHLFSILAYQLLFGILIGGFSSFVAVRRYLRN